MTSHAVDERYLQANQFHRDQTFNTNHIVNVLVIY